MSLASDAIARLPKRRLTLQEACSELNKSRKMKVTRHKQQFKEGWVDVDANTYCWNVKSIDTPTAGARLAIVKCTSSISDVFFSVLPPAVLVAVCKEIGVEKFYYGKSKVQIEDIYKMYAANLHLQAAQPHVDKGKLKNVF